jgi:Nif-specific regulatory protein
MDLAIRTNRDETMATLKERVKEFEREEIVIALRECDGVMARAARRLGITERMIGYKMKKYGIRKEEREGVTAHTTGSPRAWEA